MDDHRFDEITRSLTSGASRRGILKRVGALAGGALIGVAGVQAQTSAAPRTCTTCICGTGRPCNPKSTSCTVERGFAAQQACTTACERKGQRLCGLGNSFHCPKGCPA